MRRIAVDKARQLHRRYPGISFPVDMETLALAEGCEVIDWPFLKPVKEVKQGRFIGLAEHLDEKERRYLIAHAMGHHLLHVGNQLSFWQKTTLHKTEREAEECAAHILMPEEELARVSDLPFWEIAEHFGVPEELVGKRVKDFATDKEKYRWQARRLDKLYY